MPCDPIVLNLQLLKHNEEREEKEEKKCVDSTLSCPSTLFSLRFVELSSLKCTLGKLVLHYELLGTEAF